MFSVAPFDQHILFNNEEIIGNEETLSSFGIIPDTILYLKVRDYLISSGAMNLHKDFYLQKIFHITHILSEDIEQIFLR